MKPKVTPTFAGWVGSLNVPPKTANALIDLIGGVRNENCIRAEQAEVELEKATNGWQQHATDPFERAKKIRSGQLDVEMPDYEEFTGWL